ncbi:DUF11 domain-containing protein [Amycolatopsis acidicola]|uniref:DUF11 domain-containing protein n=1 Tax=Amycolatopsis acidicola TaxID=2596893 RepID=A0A5N0V398_9PSEU|nr:CARDB domain-containing protein [Amycolatopsis acidicola]KAA9159772.1 DUF11 domain-containing protein [Amycolatopsis acidicola]
MNPRRRTLCTVLAAATCAILPVAPALAADEPTSSAQLAPATVAQGGTFTVTEQIHNSQSFTVTGAKAALYGAERSLVDVADLVSCTGTIAPCGALGSSYRGGVGDLPAGESRTVVFTFRVKDTADPGALTLQTQLVGDNYAFDTLDGPALTVTGAPQAADIKVSLDASAVNGLLGTKITYAATVSNTGPAAATEIRLSGTYANGLVYAGSTDCTHPANTRTVTCGLPSLASGASATVKFAVVPGLLAVGPFTTTVQRTQSTPADPVATNDTASRACSALTGLLVRC